MNANLIKATIAAVWVLAGVATVDHFHKQDIAYKLAMATKVTNAGVAWIREVKK